MSAVILLRQKTDYFTDQNRTAGAMHSYAELLHHSAWPVLLVVVGVFRCCIVNMPHIVYNTHTHTHTHRRARAPTVLIILLSKLPTSYMNINILFHLLCGVWLYFLRGLTKSHSHVTATS